jgi:hypothetical protein
MRANQPINNNNNNNITELIVSMIGAVVIPPLLFSCKDKQNVGCLLLCFYFSIQIGMLRSEDISDVLA